MGGANCEQLLLIIFSILATAAPAGKRYILKKQCFATTQLTGTVRPQACCDVIPERIHKPAGTRETLQRDDVIGCILELLLRLLELRFSLLQPRVRLIQV